MKSFTPTTGKDRVPKPSLTSLLRTLRSSQSMCEAISHSKTPRVWAITPALRAVEKAAYCCDLGSTHMPKASGAAILASSPDPTLLMATSHLWRHESYLWTPSLFTVAEQNSSVSPQPVGHYAQLEIPAEGGEEAVVDSEPNKEAMATPRGGSHSAKFP